MKISLLIKNTRIIRAFEGILEFVSDEKAREMLSSLIGKGELYGSFTLHKRYDEKRVFIGFIIALKAKNTILPPIVISESFSVEEDHNEFTKNALNTISMIFPGEKEVDVFFGNPKENRGFDELLKIWINSLDSAGKEAYKLIMDSIKLNNLTGTV